MDNKVLVGELHRLANILEECEPLRLAKLAFRAKAVDGNAVDVLHGQVEVAFRSHATVDEAGDERVLQPGKNLSLLAEAFAKKIGGQRQVDELDRNLLIKLTVRTMSQIDGPHPAASQKTIDLVGTDAFAFEGICARPLTALGHTRRRAGLRNSAVECAGLRLFRARAKQSLDLADKRLVPTAERLDQPFACRWHALTAARIRFLKQQNFVKDRFEFEKACRGFVHESSVNVGPSHFRLRKKERR